MPLQCAILAGGLGTRLRPFTEARPKALVPVLGRPFADWQLRLLASQGIQRILYLVGHGADLLQDYVGDGGRYGLAVTWLSEGENLLGTAGGLRLAFDRQALEEVFFVLYGDSYLPIDMSRVANAWQASCLPALMTVLRNDGRWDRSNAVYADGRIVLYDKGPAQPAGMHWIDYGLSVLTQGIIRDRVSRGTIADLADVFKWLSIEGQLAGYEVSSRFYEAGSPAGLAELEAYLRESGRS